MNDKNRITRHKLPLCHTTGLDRYRDRHQARHGAAALGARNRRLKVATFACSACRGFHLESLNRPPTATSAPIGEGAASAPTGPRRYILVDIENLVAGYATRAEAAALWQVITRGDFGIAPSDHVVVGGNRYVAAKFSSTIAGPNIKWVVGAQEPDAADRALLAAINLHQVAKRYDELVIMSGDHAFRDLARNAKAHGLRVHVVTSTRAGRGRSLSRKLAAAADRRTTVHLSMPNRQTTSSIRTSAA